MLATSKLIFWGRIQRHASIRGNTSTPSPSLFEVTGTLHDLGPVVGAYAEIRHVFSQDAVATFASLCGDNNPIHFDTSAAQQYGVFRDKVVHGLLVSGLFSTLFGRVIHGSIYARQSLNFKNPVYINDPVVAKMVVVKVDDWKRRGLLVTCSTVCTTSDGGVAIDGEAKVLIPPRAITR